MSDRMMKLTGIFATIIVFLLFLALLCCPPDQRPIFKNALSDYKVHLGLDLKGGSELLYQINQQDIDAGRHVGDVVDETIGVISQRIFESRIVKEPRVQKQGEELILIQLPGLNQSETELVKREIETLGNLEFRLVASKNMGTEILEDTERENYDSARAGSDTRLSLYQKKLAEKGYRWYPAKEIDKADRLLWMRDGYDFTGKKFRKFQMSTDDQGRRAISFELKEEYKAGFGDFTERYKKEQLAILFNNKVIAAPSINDKISGNGILVGFEPKDLPDLLRVLRSGSLEVQPELMNESTIGPSLGEDSIRLGIIAGCIGLGAVVVFMLVYYLAAGLIAVFALLLNVIIVGAILVVWGETLTLPGIAGLVLMMGMAVDANILIFERIREEKRKLRDIFQKERGNSAEVYTKEDLLDIVKNGYSNAFSAIFDSNLTTIITAIVLYVVGAGPVKGFAFTLGWGILANFFTAIVVTRIIFEFSIEIKAFRKISMLEWIKPVKVSWHRAMVPAAVLSITFIVVGLGIFFNRGSANYGLDLKGGIIAQLSLKDPLLTEDVRKRLNENFKQIEVQNIETEEGRKVDGWYDFSIRLPNLNQEKIDELRKESVVLMEKLREKNIALKEFDTRVIRNDEELKRNKRILTRMRAQNVSEDEIEGVKNRIAKNEQVIKDNSSKLQELRKEVEELRKQRDDLNKKKELLSGVEELKHVVREKFKTELSPLPFGTMTVGEGRFRSYYVLPTFLRTNLPSQFIKTILQKQDMFKEVHIGSVEFSIFAKLSQATTEEDLVSNLRNKLDSASRIEPQEIKVHKSTQAEFDSMIVVKFASAVPEYAVKNGVERCDWAKFEIRPTQDMNAEMKQFHLFLLLPNELLVKSTPELQKMAEEKIRTALKEEKYLGKTIYLSDPFPRFTQISGLVAKEQKAKSYQAIFLSLLFILFYIVLRFPNGFMFGFSAVVALGHDVAFTLAAIAIFTTLGMVSVEIDLTVIAALLTIVGYSINNTIVIFDRLRENQHKFDAEEWARFSIKRVTTEWNHALSQTLSRTIFTSLTTLFSVLAIFILNVGQGNSMEGFSFAMIVGIAVGTYSSILLASGLVLFFERRNRRE